MKLFFLPLLLLFGCTPDRPISDFNNLTPDLIRKEQLKDKLLTLRQGIYSAAMFHGADNFVTEEKMCDPETRRVLINDGFTVQFGFLLDDPKHKVHCLIGWGAK